MISVIHTLSKHSFLHYSYFSFHMLILNFLNVELRKFEKAECCFRIFCKFKCFIQMHLDEVKTSGLLVRIFSRRHLLLKRDRELICWKHARIDLKFWTFHSYQVIQMNIIRKVWLYLSFEWNQIVTITRGLGTKSKHLHKYIKWF